MTMLTRLMLSGICLLGSSNMVANESSNGVSRPSPELLLYLSSMFVEVDGEWIDPMAFEKDDTEPGTNGLQIRNWAKDDVETRLHPENNRVQENDYES
jgi:hypothetical protein